MGCALRLNRADPSLEPEVFAVTLADGRLSGLAAETRPVSRCRNGRCSCRSSFAATAGGAGVATAHVAGSSRLEVKWGRGPHSDRRGRRPARAASIGAALLRRAGPGVTAVAARRAADVWARGAAPARVPKDRAPLGHPPGHRGRRARRIQPSVAAPCGTRSSSWTSSSPRHKARSCSCATR
jgi:hypothetical protein